MSIRRKKAKIEYMSGAELIEWQKRHNLSNDDFALLMGVTINTVCFWRNERNPIDRRTFMLLHILEGKHAWIQQWIDAALDDYNNAILESMSEKLSEDIQRAYNEVINEGVAKDG